MKDLLVLLAHLLTTIAKLSRPGAFTGVGFITFNEYLSAPNYRNIGWQKSCR